MPLYEHVFLARQDASTQQVEELTAQMTGIVEQAGGKITKTENWGVRSLTYRMNKNRKAHFVLLNIEAPSTAIAEIERQERISEDVIRYLSVRVEEHEEGPSAMMRRSWCTPSVFPPPQDLPVHGPERAEDRLQGFQAVDALRVRARQDRAEPHHRGLRQEAARTRARHQACAFPRSAALRHSLNIAFRRPPPAERKLS